MNELHRDPPRWLESGALSQELARELAAYGAQAPVEASKQRMLAQLTTQLAETPIAAQPVAFVKVKLLLVGSAIVAGAVGLLQFRPPVPAQVCAAEQVERTATRVAPLEQTLLAAELAPLESFEEAVSSEPSSERHVRVTRRAPAAQRGVASAGLKPPPEPLRTQTVQTDVLAELTMLARARRALLNDPARALELSEQHARNYPRGTFDEEREVLAIESLLKLGRKDEARARERAFEANFPRSAQIAHLAKLIAKPGE